MALPDWEMDPVPEATTPTVGRALESRHQEGEAEVVIHIKTMESTIDAHVWRPWDFECLL